MENSASGHNISSRAFLSAFRPNELWDGEQKESKIDKASLILAYIFSLKKRFIIVIDKIFNFQKQSLDFEFKAKRGWEMNWSLPWVLTDFRTDVRHKSHDAFDASNRKLKLFVIKFKVFESFDSFLKP